jgi:ABC-type branched-subunit amino acid transport system substrate-binding protein
VTGRVVGLKVLAMIQGPAGAARRPERDYILIGHPNPSTGPLSVMGETSPWAYEKAIAAINASGGIAIWERGLKLPVKVKMVDTESDPSKAIGLATRARKAKVT